MTTHADCVLQPPEINELGELVIPGMLDHPYRSVRVKDVTEATSKLHHELGDRFAGIRPWNGEGSFEIRLRDRRQIGLILRKWREAFPGKCTISASKSAA